MDAGLILSILMLVGWGTATVLLNPAPGWVHGLLTVGSFLLVWRIARPVRSPSSTGRSPSSDPSMCKPLVHKTFAKTLDSSF